MVHFDRPFQYINDNNFDNLDLTNHPALYEFRGYNNRLTNLNLQNGTNYLFVAFPSEAYRFQIQNNPNLFCVLVDDVDNSNLFWTLKDSQTQYAQNLSDCPSSCDEVAIPDPNFEQYLVDNNIDTDGTINGVICREDAEAATFLFITDFAGISSMDFTGIDAFINLETFLLQPFDVNDNSKKDIQNLDFSTMLNLSDLTIQNTQLTTVDISTNINLTLLDVSENNLTDLDITPNLALVRVDCSKNQITTLDVGVLPNLEILRCQENLIPFLDVSSNPSLKELIAHDNLLTTNDFIVDGLASIETIDVTRNNLVYIDVTIYSTLKFLYARSNDLSGMDFTMNPVLEYVDIRNNFFVDLDFSMNPKLSSLQANNNTLKSLNVRNGSLEHTLWASLNPNLFCIQVDDPDTGKWVVLNPNTTVLPTDPNSAQPANYGGAATLLIDQHTELKEDCTPELDTVGTLIGPDNVSVGQEVTISVDYTATTDRAVVLAFQQENPYAHVESQLVDVPAGSGSVDFTFTVPGNVNVGHEHNYVAFITQAASSNPWGDKFDVERKTVTVSAAPSNADTVNLLSGPENVSAGQEVTISIGYTATTDRSVVLAFQQENPYAHVESQLVDVPAGSGTVDFTFTVPGNVNVGHEHNYVTFITKAVTTNPWGDKFDVETKVVTVSAPTSTDTVSSLSGPDSIGPGQEVTISVDYTATTDRAVVLAFQQENPYAHVESQLVDVPAGSGTVDFTFTVPGSVTVGHEHNYVAFITKSVTTNPWGDKFDVETKAVTIISASPLMAQLNESEIRSVASVEVFPNPVVEFLTVNLPEESNATYMRMMNFAGTTLMQDELPSRTRSIQIDMSSYAPGIYLLEVRSGSETNMFKIVKK